MRGQERMDRDEKPRFGGKTYGLTWRAKGPAHYGLTNEDLLEASGSLGRLSQIWQETEAPWQRVLRGCKSRQPSGQEQRFSVDSCAAGVYSVLINRRKAVHDTGADELVHGSDR